MAVGEHFIESLIIVRITSRRFVSTAILAVLAIVAGACGKGIFPSADSSSSSGGGGGGGTTRSVYVTNFADGKLSSLILNSSTGSLTGPATISAGAASGPLGMARFSTLALYAANASDNLIHEYTLDTNGNLTSLATIAAGTAPQQVAVTPSGTYAYAVNNGSGSISEYVVNSTTGKLSANTQSSTGTGVLVTPISLVATNSFLYLTDTKNNSGSGVVWTYTINSDGTLAANPNSTSTLATLPAIPGQIVLDSTSSFAFIPDASGSLSVFQAVNSSLSFLMTATTGAGVAPAGLAFASDIGGNQFVYVTNPTGNSVSVMSWDSTSVTLTAASVTSGVGLDQPSGLAVTSSTATPYLYVTNAGNGTITQFTINTSDGSLTENQSFATESPSNSASQPMDILLTD